MAKLTDIFRSNVNALMKKFENPSYLVDLKLDDAKEEIKKVQQELGNIKAEEMAVQRKVDSIKEQMAEYENLAQMAVEKGNDEDALKFIRKKNEFLQELENAEKLYETSKKNSKAIENIYNQLEEKIKSMASDASVIKSQMSIAKAQEKINDITSMAKNSNSVISEFDNLKNEAQKRLDAANAIANLDKGEDEIEELKDKYENKNTQRDMEELEQLKAKLGK